jgi:hypothetical protein
MVIPTGKFTGNWVYENKEMGLSIQLPTSWYMQDHLGKYRYDIPLDQPMSNANPADLIIPESIPLKDIKELKTRGPVPLYTMFDIHEIETEYGQTKPVGVATISFSIVLSKNQDEEEDIQDLIAFMKPNWDKHPEIDLKKESIKVGNKELKGFSFKPPLLQGLTITRLSVLKNCGCYNLGIFIDYSTQEQLQKIQKILATAKLL